MIKCMNDKITSCRVANYFCNIISPRHVMLKKSIRHHALLVGETAWLSRHHFIFEYI